MDNLAGLRTGHHQVQDYVTTEGQDPPSFLVWHRKIEVVASAYDFPA